MEPATKPDMSTGDTRMTDSGPASTTGTELAIQDAPAPPLFTVAPEHRERIGKAQNVLFLANREDLAAVTAAAPDDLLVVGLDGPAGWRDAKGKAIEGLRGLLLPERKSSVYLNYPGAAVDIPTYEEAKAIGQYLGRAAKKTRHITGCEHTIEELLEDVTDRGAELAGLMKQAANTPGRRPAAPKTRNSAFPVVDMERGQIYVPTENGRAVLVELGAAIVRTYRIYDDLKLDAEEKKTAYMHDLEVVITRDGIRKEYEIPSVPDSVLGNPRRWINRLRGGTSIAVNPVMGAAAGIEAAVRDHNAGRVEEIPVLTRTGWAEFDGVWGFLHPKGFITPIGNTQFSRAQIGGGLEIINFPDPAELTIEEERAAALNTLRMSDEVTLPGMWSGPWGAIIHSVAGLGVGVVPGVFGKKGSGKTTVVYGMSAHMADEWAARSMFVIDSSSKNIAKYGIGLESLFMVVDDMRERNTLNKASEQSEGLEYLVRSGYAGGSARYSANEKDPDTGQWLAGTPDLSSPTVIVVGEEMPDGDGTSLDSTKERLFPSRIPLGFNVFASGGADLFVALSRNGLPRVHMAAFIRWVAAGIEDAGGREVWRETWLEKRRVIAEARKNLGVSHRVRQTAAVIETGNIIWMEYLVSIGAVTAEDAEHRLSTIKATVTKTAVWHGTENITADDAPEYDAVLNSLRAAVWSGSAAVATHSTSVVAAQEPGVKEYVSEVWDPSNTRMRLLGAFVKGRSDTGSYLAIQPRDALTILATESQFRGLTEKKLLNIFKPVSLVDPKKLYKTLTVKGLRTNVLALPWHLWTSKGEFAPETPEDEPEIDVLAQPATTPTPALARALEAGDEKWD